MQISIVMDIDTEARVHTITQSSKGEQRTLKNVKLFGKTVLTVTLGFWLAVLIIATVGIIPLTQLIVGIVHKNACPMNYLIPIYLIVAGVIGLILVTISILQVSVILISIATMNNDIFCK